MATRESRNDAELMRLVINEVDQARDLYELAQQIAPHLPISSFDELTKINDGKRLRFRDAEFDVESLRAFVPAVVFPVQDLEGLVERLGHVLRMVPPEMGVDVTTESGMRRQLRNTGAVTPGIGLMSQRKSTASVLGAGVQGKPTS